MADLGKSPSNRPPAVRLRRVEEADLSVLMRFNTDAEVTGLVQWFGYGPASARDGERAMEGGWAAGRLVVEVGGEFAGRSTGAPWKDGCRRD